MQMPVIVGVLVALIFLVAFSEWFYHMIIGWNELVIDDVYFRYRIVGVSLFSFFIMGSTFFIMALVNECPNKQREGIFAGLRCDEYNKIRTTTERFFPKSSDDTTTLEGV